MKIKKCSHENLSKCSQFVKYVSSKGVLENLRDALYQNMIVSMTLITIQS